MARPTESWHCAGLALLAVFTCAQAPAAEGDARGLYFDDFTYPDAAALQAQGWRIRDSAGHPGIPGAQWGARGVALVDDPARAGNRLLRLQAGSNGEPQGTWQTQLCQARKFLEGTYAARIRLSDAPVLGPASDFAVEAFYLASPLRHDFDPDFSEVDWEYLPQGGWGSSTPRQYAISWQTVRLDPWAAWNQPAELPGRAAGWHVLIMQVDHQRVRFLRDGIPVAEATGRNVPVAAMALSFSLWFSPGHPDAGSRVPRIWEEDVDWVFHAQGRQLSPEAVEQAVGDLRSHGVERLDTVAPAQPALDSPCAL